MKDEPPRCEAHFRMPSNRLAVSADGKRGKGDC